MMMQEPFLRLNNKSKRKRKLNRKLLRKIHFQLNARVHSLFHMAVICNFRDMQSFMYDVYSNIWMNIYVCILDADNDVSAFVKVSIAKWETHLTHKHTNANEYTSMHRLQLVWSRRTKCNAKLIEMQWSVAYTKTHTQTHI